MGYTPRQIGWSQKSIILQEISRQLDLLIKATASLIPVVSGWILATNFWNDSGTWIDGETWND